MPLLPTSPRARRPRRTLERTRVQLAEGQRIAHLGSWEYIAATQTTVWSEEQKRIYGLDPAQPSPAYEVMLRHHIHPGDAAELDRSFREALQHDAPFENENRVIRPDGTVRWIYNKAQPYFDEHGKLLRYIGATLDITERQQAEEALRESREDLNRAQAVAHTGSWRLDVQENELTWSEETHRIFGIPLETPLTYETFLGAVHPDDRDYVDQKWTAAMRGEPYDIEHRIVVDGAVKWVREQAELEFNQAGELLGGFGTAQDITARQAAEAALRESEAQLQTVFDNLSEGVVVSAWTANC